MVEDKEITPEQKIKMLRDGQAELGQIFLANLLPLIGNEGDKPEINFWKTTVHMPNGGIYLLSLAHVDGPKYTFENDAS